MPDPPYEILQQRGQCLLTNGDDKYKDKDKYDYKDRKSFKKNGLINVYRFKFHMLMYIC